MTKTDWAKCECRHHRYDHIDGAGECEYELWDGGADGWLEESCDCKKFVEQPPANLNGQPAPPSENEGVLTIDVWPVYMGVGESTDDFTLIEQFGHPDYQRGQIRWDTQPDGEIVGFARVLLPAGMYTHLMFCNGPSEMLVAIEKLEHPLMFDRPGFYDVHVQNKMQIPRPG